MDAERGGGFGRPQEAVAVDAAALVSYAQESIVSRTLVPVLEGKAEFT